MLHIFKKISVESKVMILLFFLAGSSAALAESDSNISLRHSLIECPSIDISVKGSLERFRACSEINQKIAKQWADTIDKKQCENSIGIMARHMHSLLELAKLSGEASDILYPLVRQEALRTECPLTIESSPASIFAQQVVSDYESGLPEDETVHNALEICKQWKQVSHELVLGHDWCKTYDPLRYKK